MVVVEAVEVEETVGLAETVVATATTEVVSSQGELPEVAAKIGSAEPSILIFRMVSGGGAVCISVGVDLHFSVQSPVPAPGRMFILLKNEPVTNSAKKNLNSLTTHCTRNRSFQKYTQYMEMKFSQSRSLYYPQLSGVLKMFGKILSR